MTERVALCSDLAVLIRSVDVDAMTDCSNFGGAESMVMKFHGHVHGEVQANFLALSASKPHIFMRDALKLFQIVRANVRLSIAIPSLLLFLIHVLCKNQKSQNEIEPRRGPLRSSSRFGGV